MGSGRTVTGLVIRFFGGIGAAVSTGFMDLAGSNWPLVPTAALAGFRCRVTFCAPGIVPTHSGPQQRAREVSCPWQAGFSRPVPPAERARAEARRSLRSVWPRERAMPAPPTCGCASRCARARRIAELERRRGRSKAVRRRPSSAAHSSGAGSSRRCGDWPSGTDYRSVRPKSMAARNFCADSGSSPQSSTGRPLACEARNPRSGKISSEHHRLLPSASNSHTQPLGAADGSLVRRAFRSGATGISGSEISGEQGLKLAERSLDGHILPTPEPGRGTAARPGFRGRTR